MYALGAVGFGFNLGEDAAAEAENKRWDGEEFDLDAGHGGGGVGL